MHLVAPSPVPVCGCNPSMLVFPHGDVTALLHEGSPVTRGMKYVVRTEVEFPFDGVRH
jgi:hypothetical protein